MYFAKSDLIILMNKKVLEWFKIPLIFWRPPTTILHRKLVIKACHEVLINIIKANVLAYYIYYYELVHCVHRWVACCILKRLFSTPSPLTCKQQA